MAPAGERPAQRRPGGMSILPGGRVIAPLGRQYGTGPGPFGIAVNGRGDMVATADGGPNRYAVTVLQREDNKWVSSHIVAPHGKYAGFPEDEWHAAFMGLAFWRNRQLFHSEGNSGKIRLIEVPGGRRIATIELDREGYKDSYSGDLALDGERGLLYAVDQANFRVVVIDARRRRVRASVRVGRLPFALALSEDKRRLFVTNLGMFEYRPVPGADPKRARQTGLPFPAFGFPSVEAREGVRRENASGEVVEVAGLGDPNVAESNSVCVVDVSNPDKPRVEKFIRTGKPFSAESLGGSSPSGITVAGGRVYVANAHNDSITVVDANKLEVVGEVALRIPGLEHLRGILPIGVTVHPPTGWLLVAEAGINAIGVIDTWELKVLGHLPVGWFPTAVRVHGDNVYVSNAKGHGTGPNAVRKEVMPETFQGELRRGSISVFALPTREQLPEHTQRVMEYAGFVPRAGEAPQLPATIKHVVVIVKENRTFDEVLGDITKAANGAVMGAPALARFGRRGVALAPAGGKALSLRNVDISPNHHALAERFAFSDNFYADSEVSVDGHHWLVGSYPNAWTESSLMAAYGGQKDFRMPTQAPGRLQFAQSNSSVHPEEQLEAGALWHHLERHGISFRNYGEGFELAGVDEGKDLEPTGVRVLTNVPMPDPLYRNTSRRYPQYNMNIPDQYRADAFIAEVKELYLEGKQPFPQFVFLHLPNDHLAKPRPEDGYPYEASFMVDNDYALGRIVEFLSHTPWWKEMAILITEDDAQGGVDHIDSHRTVLLVVSPYAKRNYVSHAHSSFPGLLKTAFRLLGLPPLNLFDATATDLSDCFTLEPDFTPYEAQPVDTRVFDPARARKAQGGEAGPRMDDPGFLREQHRQR